MCKLQPQANLETLVKYELAHPDVLQLETPRLTITVDDALFRERLRTELRR
jgi:hypothetical protein